jgi:hypothetical protein
MKNLLRKDVLINIMGFKKFGFLLKIFCAEFLSPKFTKIQN